MTPEDLPEDINQWPQNPWELLGVKPTEDPKDIKRAYHRLVKRFKPEQYPEQFARIREAYESCVDQSSHYQDWNNYEAVVEEKPKALQDDKLNTAWDMALQGKFVEAYALLVKFQNDKPEDVGCLLRLYWLLSLAPNLDRPGSRHYWLRTALVASQLESAAFPLWLREVDANPAIILGHEYVEVLEHEMNINRRIAYAKAVIRAAGYLKRYHLIHEVVKSVKSLSVDMEPVGWLNFLQYAFSWGVWGGYVDLRTIIKNELYEWKELELKESDLFDRFEITNSIADVVNQVVFSSQAAVSLIDLAIIGWADCENSRLDVIKYLANVLAREYSFESDKLQSHAEMHGTSLLNCAKLALKYYLSKTDNERLVDLDMLDLKEIVKTFNAKNYEEYSLFRKQVLLFILEHDITPGEFHETFVAIQGTRLGYIHLYQAFESDLAVEFLYLLHKVAR